MQRSAPARNQHWAESIDRRQRVLNIATWLAAVVTSVVGVLQLVTGDGLRAIGAVNLVTAAIFVGIPLLHRFGEIIAALTFVFFAFLSLTIVGWQVGTDSGIQFYYLVSASLAVLVLGVEHIVMASTVVVIGAGLTIASQFLVPGDTGIQPRWLVNAGFVITTVSACVMIFATVWYAMREVSRAEAAMEVEYKRSEALLANILPASIAARLKDPGRGVIADRYDDASILFADIAGFTERASQIPPAELVRFLDRLYTTFDRLVDKHGLEKIKTTGDSYMVVSGVPQPRADHVQALATLALDMAKAVRDLRDPNGQPVPLRIGMAAGPVVAGVVGARRFFYDVWGDAVNVASRMETTDPEGRIQVPQDVYERLRNQFVLEERGDVDVKGKGLMRTWYLVDRRALPTAGDRPVEQASAT
ncbi:adenylate/guanylate cyclase domain-containing protein [Mycobacterium sp. CVI_P3]|uniref:Adenylate/guanylate cyclase domain-containing protein n=1 Tax=Mycobacterium pinniadriaticum TaxID=2994102 RepID=A0ABT3SLP0_9MYCO|nr:adenylate/guanylate cyclase domain-containing protein [Mycobacterium pinniadriaticum]MCX2934063.1 adenylate/guanylate cyclase domain-containing protein [Mycobacterium pinniadriaticum]MCX2940440.1 adenylate/guanylate cyclase domain-containing protein [Mycobacterium pinniadriaticum]